MTHTFLKHNSNNRFYFLNKCDLTLQIFPKISHFFLMHIFMYVYMLHENHIFFVFNVLNKPAVDSFDQTMLHS